MERNQTSVIHVVNPSLDILNYYECGTCGKPFTLECNLKRQALIHTSEKLYECAYGKTLYQTRYLNRHLKEHTGKKQCECDTRGKVFVCYYNLNKLINVNTEKPYA